MTEPDEALLWALSYVKIETMPPEWKPAFEGHAEMLATAYRAGQAASAERIKALEEALTPNGATKAAYIGEFRQAMNDRSRRDADIYGEVAVEWSLIKEIMKAIRDHADALLKEADHD